MKTMRIRRPSPALIVALIALFFSLGGTSYAAFKLPAKSVKATHLANNAVITAKLKNAAVTTAKLKNNSVTTAKIKPGAVTDACLALKELSSIAVAGGIVDTSGAPVVKSYFNRRSPDVVTVERESMGRYLIAIPGLTFQRDSNIAMVTLFTGGAARVLRIGSTDGKLLLLTRDLSDAAADPQGFSFVVYK